jgi:hypothetical protein
MEPQEFGPKEPSQEELKLRLKDYTHGAKIGPEAILLPLPEEAKHAGLMLMAGGALLNSWLDEEEGRAALQALANAAWQLDKAVAVDVATALQNKVGPAWDWAAGLVRNHEAAASKATGINIIADTTAQELLLMVLLQ